MIPITVRPSGDYATINAAISAINVILGNGTGLQDHMQIQLQGNVTHLPTVNIANSNAKFNGKTITLTTYPAERATPAIVSAERFITSFSATDGPAIIKYEGLILKAYGMYADMGLFMANNELGGESCQVSDCAIYVTMPIPSDHELAIFGTYRSTDNIMNNCSLFVTGDEVRMVRAASMINYKGIIRNTIICTYSSYAAELVLDQTVPHTNNSIFNYGTGGFTANLAPGATAPNLTTANPQFIDDIIQNSGDGVDTMATRNARLNTGSPCIDTADVTTASSVDILGNLRS